MIEGDKDRYNHLVENYKDNPGVIPVNRFVDTGRNSLSAILEENDFADLDFLSIDIDGLDYEIFSTLAFRPRVICVEVNAGHSPDTLTLLDADVAKNNVGQPFMAFHEAAQKMGYDLVCYNANAFFVLSEERHRANLPILNPTEAYTAFLKIQKKRDKEFLCLVNNGHVNPNYRYKNPYLSRKALGIGLLDYLIIRIEAWHPFLRKAIYKAKMTAGFLDK